MIRIAVFALITDRDLSRAIGRFLGKLKCLFRELYGFEYLVVNEWSEGHRHMHILVRTRAELTPRMIGELWEKTLPGLPFTHYCKPVRNPIGIANYVVKHLKDDAKKELPPESFRGKVYLYSHGFFTKKVAALWKEQIQEWYPGQ
jgi:hypothetical protein